MATANHFMKRPERWETPFGESMTDADVAELLQRAPFSTMEPANFPASLSLAAILRNDARIVTYRDGEMIIREGDYGSSAFLILSGTVQVVLRNLPQQMLGRSSPQKNGWLSTLARWWHKSSYPEVRRGLGSAEQGSGMLARPHIFLQDIPALLGPDDTLHLHDGELFGELAALTRTPRSATVLSVGTTRLLEIRWQGLRDLLRFDDALRHHIDDLYRANSLRVHLRETPLLSRLSPEALQEVADATQFATYGNFDWQHRFLQQADADPQERILSEPLIAEEGDYPDGLLLLRNGFARLSQRCDSGHRTLSYLGKGDVFGLRELVRNWRRADVHGWEASLRAVGYVDVLRIPVPVVEQLILPTLSDAELATFLADAPATRSAIDSRNSAAETGIFYSANEQVEAALLEFLVDNRLVNGTAAMVIDLDRCTRCDDCVRACAATHDNNPRFTREGLKHDRFQIAQACMHCIDPVCMIGCPTGAIHRHADTGLAIINDDTCIGCATCANSCPYQNIRMVEIRNPQGELYVDPESQLPILKATKCDFCVGQLGGPACVRACPHDALVRIDLSDVQAVARLTQL
jgi:Fe-S-cluster-containing dehydrogenase component/CRP-like cAMP-binding protein